ncbi:MAG: 4Fe-4S dicluster domain-containing protein [Candidatus Bathyarchaeales archaeon]
MPERIWRKPLDSEKAKLPKAEIHIIQDQCKGCGFCIQYCPQKVLEESNDINARGVHPPRVVDESKCVLCSFCMSVCPDFAIFVVEKKECKENVKRD